MPKAVDLTEHRFGKLVAKSRGENDSSGHSRWYCLCDCQLDKPTDEQQLYLVRTTYLTQNITTSCPNCRISPTSHDIKRYNQYDLTGEYGVGITSNTNEEFYFDLEDYDLIKGYTWFVDNRGYLRATNTSIRMHDLVMCTDDVTMMVDHIYHNKLDNRKNRLRIVTNSQNQMNRDIPKNNTSGVRGVSWHERKQKWIAQIGVDGKLIYLGIFSNKEDAVIARKQAEEKYFGEFNFKIKKGQ